MTAEEIDREHQKDLQRLKGFRLLDDEFMTKVFEGDPKYIQLVLRMILDMPDLTVIHVRTQVFVENLVKRSVRLDILATDESGRKFNVEIQRADTDEDRKRARYYSSMVDIYLAKRGSAFHDLPETWVIFITEKDVLGHGEPLYEIERCILQTGERFQDGSHIVYVNGAYRGDTPLGKLMHDFRCTNPEDMYFETLADRVRFLKESEEGVATMCKMLEDMREEYLQRGIEQGREQGLKQGLEQGLEQGLRSGAKGKMEEIALRMLRVGKYAMGEIADMAGLPLAEVQRLKIETSA